MNKKIVEIVLMAFINSINYSYKCLDTVDNIKKAEKSLLLANKIFVFSKCTAETTAQLKKIIKEEVVVSEVGRKILKQLFIGPKITIIEGETFSYSAVYGITVNLNVSYYYMCYNEGGEKRLQLGTWGQAFVHECIHALNYLKKPGGYKDLPKDHLFEEMDNMEEQITICGKMHTHAIQFFCENAFLAAQQKPYRINHRALLLPTHESITWVDFACLGLIKPLTEALEDTPSIINLSEKLHASRASCHGLQGKKLTLLSAAAIGDRKEIVDMLLSHGADPLVQDDLGGAFFAALDQKKFHILSQLLAHHPVAPQHKNLQGNTLFSQFCLATQQFSTNNDPIFWKTVAGCFTKLMDPQQPVIPQILQNKASGHLVKALVTPGEALPVNQNGDTLLMTAIKEKDIRLFKELIDDFPFNLDAANAHNETPLLLALSHTDAELSSEMVWILKERGAHIPPELQTRVDTLLKPTYGWQF